MRASESIVVTAISGRLCKPVCGYPLDAIHSLTCDKSFVCDSFDVPSWRKSGSLILTLADMASKAGRAS